MKTATLIALIGSVLILLYWVIFFLSSFYLVLTYLATGTVRDVLLIFFYASLSYFFLVLYKNQKS
jgi:hypothetical protein